MLPNGIRRIAQRFRKDPTTQRRKQPQDRERLLCERSDGREPVSTAAHFVDRVMIYQCVVAEICRNALAWVNEETGGQLFGAFRGSGIPVAMHTVLPGQGAEHRALSFSQDTDHLRTEDEYLHDRFGLCCIGRWHKHPPGFCEPSSGDKATARSIIAKNHMVALVETIVTTDPGNGRVRFSPYVYTLDRPFDANPVDLVVIPGLRFEEKAAGGNPAFQLEQMFAPGRTLSVGDPNGSLLDAVPDADVPQSLVDQIEDLPEEAQDGLRVTVDGGSTCVEFSVGRQATAYVEYARSDGQTPLATCIGTDTADELRDVSARVNPTGRALSLAGIYRRLVLLLDADLGDHASPPFEARSSEPHSRSRRKTASDGASDEVKSGRGVAGRRAGSSSKVKRLNPAKKRRKRLSTRGRRKKTRRRR